MPNIAGIPVSEKPRTVTVAMEYIGSDLSVNHYLGRNGGRHFVKKDVKKWKSSLGWLLKTAHIEEWKKPLKIHLDGVFKDSRSCPDLHNLTKVILDGIEDASGINDKWMKVECATPVIDKSMEPEIFITVSEEL